MTLPFRRRHHDDESIHDRARLIWSTGLLEPVDPTDEAWLEAHLAGCGECRLERDGYVEDRQLLRALRDQAPEPPRDLWARTAAAIELESGRRSRQRGSALPFPDRLVPRRARFPLGVMSGLLVAIVVVATSLAPRTVSPTGTIPGGSAVAVVAPGLGPSPLAVDTAPLGWLQRSADGSYQLLLADVNEVCPDEKSACAPLGTTTANRSALRLEVPPQAIVGSPNNKQIVVVAGSGGSTAGSVLVVPVPTLAPEKTSGPAASVAAASSQSAPPPSVAIPTATPASSTAPTPVATPEGARSIAEGVIVVGETAYSPNGKWLAFAARPLDGSAGPDLYLWSAGSPAAVAVTTDHRTVFAGWLDGRILASRVLLTPATEPSSEPSSEPSPATPIEEAHPVSFLFDPETEASVDLPVPDVWLPTVDPKGRFATYWSGTLVPDAAGTGWLPGTGRLVLDGWTKPLGFAEATGEPSASVGSAQPSANRLGPVGVPTELVAGPIAAFEARFDPSGTRLAVWVADTGDPSVGTLRLVVLDHRRGEIDLKLSPLPSVRALHGISIDHGRLAWVTPPGQDGQQSVVQVLAWSKDSFGQIETVPAEQLYIVR